jgi:hypothetical protein
MSDEKHTEQGDWRDRLEALGEIEAPAQRDALWGKLEARLTPQKRRGFGWWLALAAAMIVGLVVGVRYLQPAKEVAIGFAAKKSLAPILPSIKETTTAEITLTPPSRKETTAAVTTFSPSTQTEQTTRHAGFVTQLPARTRKFDLTQKPNRIANPLLVAETTQLAILPSFDTNVVALKPPTQTKMKLKVVHFNELEVAKPPLPNYAEAKPSNTYHRYIVPSNQDNLIHIRLSPSN